MQRGPANETQTRFPSDPSGLRGEPRQHRGVTLIELVVVFAIIAVLVGVAIPVIGRARTSAKSAACLSNLSNIGMAFHFYANQNNDAFPNPGDAGTQWEDMLGPYTNRNMFCCPADPELFSALSSSYDWRDTSDPSSTLAGKENSTNIRQNAVLSFDALPGWHSTGYMNAVHVDNSTESMPQEACMGDILKPVTR